MLHSVWVRGGSRSALGWLLRLGADNRVAGDLFGWRLDDLVIWLHLLLHVS